MPHALDDLYQAQQRRTATTMVAARRLWASMPDDFDAGWRRVGPRLVALLTGAQLGAATDGAYSVGASLREQGAPVDADMLVAPESLAGMASDGRPLDSLLYSTVVHARSAPADSLAGRLAAARSTLDRIVQVQVADAARAGQSLSIATRPGVGYVRYVNPPCCKRCAEQAGKFFRWNDGFKRHPHCDCIHVPSAGSPPAGYVPGVSVRDITDLSSSEARALQDIAGEHGEDFALQNLSQVVNARRGGLASSALTTSEGMGRRGLARKHLGDGRRRLTPEGIYRIASDREHALQLLEQHGYLVGEVRGKNYEGWGQMGRGGTRAGARAAIERARMTGVRHPGSLATMTAAERRAFDAANRSS